MPVSKRLVTVVTWLKLRLGRRFSSMIDQWSTKHDDIMKQSESQHQLQYLLPTNKWTLRSFVWSCLSSASLTSAPQFAGSNLVAKNPQKPKWQHGMGNLPDLAKRNFCTASMFKAPLFRGERKFPKRQVPCVNDCLRKSTAASVAGAPCLRVSSFS